MTVVGIHQPNYLPWAGFFHKMVSSDIFVFLDDAQFTKNGYVNRVLVRARDGSAWLTVPAKPKLGTAISAVKVSQEDWPLRHLARLRNEYGKTAFFASVWPEFESVFNSLPSGSLADSNVALIQWIAEKLKITTHLRRSSDLPNVNGLSADDRLIELVGSLGGDRYYSGKGGNNYQSAEKFAAAGIALEFTRFEPLPYPCVRDQFLPGLSIVDCVFENGWEAAALYVRRELKA